MQRLNSGCIHMDLHVLLPTVVPECHFSIASAFIQMTIFTVKENLLLDSAKPKRHNNLRSCICLRGWMCTITVQEQCNHESTVSASNVVISRSLFVEGTTLRTHPFFKRLILYFSHVHSLGLWDSHCTSTSPPQHTTMVYILQYLPRTFSPQFSSFSRG